MNPIPRVGQILQVYGQDCKIVVVYPYGTVDVTTLDGSRSYRVTGLGYSISSKGKTK